MRRQVLFSGVLQRVGKLVSLEGLQGLACTTFCVTVIDQQGSADVRMQTSGQRFDDSADDR